jgi:hypothetical protein
MDFSQELKPSNIKIEHFIFHIVHQGEEKTYLLDETPLGKYESFFADRIIETIEGNRFKFLDSSLVMNFLHEINSDINDFVPISKKMAEHFQSFQNDLIKPGVLILMVIKIAKERFFSIIKYDHEEVLAYKLDKKGSKAILEEVSNSFTKSKDSLHKSALIKLGNKTGELLIIDKKVRSDISVFFKGFLGVERKYSQTELTTRVERIVLDVTKKYRNELPQDFLRSIRKNVYDISQSGIEFTHDAFYDKIFGIHGNENIKKDYYKSFKKSDIFGEVFSFDKKVLRKPRKIKIRTEEGIQISYDDSVQDRVSIKEDKAESIITIKTEKFFYDR